jgi:hypothetical protein
MLLMFSRERLSKWFYDTSTSTTTRAAPCGSFLQGLRSLVLQLWMKQGGYDDFMWFRTPDHNTLRPQDELYCYVYVLQANAKLT